MDKTFTVLQSEIDPSIPTQIRLKINENQVAEIVIIAIDKFCMLLLAVYNDNWSLLPVIAADLYHHTAGAGIGYASRQAAAQAAAAILTAHGWKESK